MFEWIRYVHIACAMISISGFVLRGVWMLQGSRLLQSRLAKIAPHFVDSLLLLSALILLFMSDWSVVDHAWLQVKLLALLLYIGLGMMALKYAVSRSTRLLSWLAAIGVFAYIVSVALTKSPLGILYWIV